MSVLSKVGISDIAIYLPRFRIDLATIINKRSQEQMNPTQEKSLHTILEKTGLLSMYFPEFWEDTVTMAAEASHRLIERNQFNLSALRYFVTGTETSVDHSKPISAYVLGILKKAGLHIPQTLSTFQTQHACAGGTVALLGVSALLGISGSPLESGIMICSDIARYQKLTSAELTQGAGAVAVLTESNPKLIEFDLKSVGYSSKDVDDFFRPLGSDVAKVKGGFSVRCYMEAMESALNDHASRIGSTPEKVLLNTDMFALHVPYPRLPLDTMKYLLNKYLKMESDAAEQFLREKGFFAMIHPVSRSGNIYTGSLYLSLAFLLKERHALMNDKIIGKSILMGSYGSGNTMVFISGRITEGAPKVIQNWDLEKIWDSKQATLQDYEDWLSAKDRLPFDVNSSSPAAKSFYLHRIREDGYREYQYQK